MQNKLVTRQDAIDYMEKMILKHTLNLCQQHSNRAPEEVLQNIRKKITCYKIARLALLKVGDSNARI